MIFLTDTVDRQDWSEIYAQTGLDAVAIDAMILIRLRGMTEHERPSIHHMLGAPGSGKSTFVKRAMQSGEFPADAIVISFDQIMESLPGYQTDHLLNGAEEAMARWELPVRAIGYSLLENAAARGINIVFDHGGASGSDQGHVKLLEVIKEHYRYDVHLHWLDVVPATCLQRIAKRVRYVNPELIKTRSQLLAKLMPAYKKLATSFHAHSETMLDFKAAA